MGEGAAERPPATGNGATGRKPLVLIIGGLGYIGRFLALHIHKHQLAEDVRLVDKHLPELAFLAPEFSEACSRDKFVQADASKEASIGRVFDRADGREFEYVFNCGGETRYSQDDEVYRARSLALSLTVGREAARRRARAFVELSTGMVYKAEAAPRRETDRTKPWTKLAHWKLQAEEELARVDGLPLVVLRLAHVYGPYTSRFMATALCMARVYQALGRDMKWLWDRDLRSNTVHVEDVARATWAAAGWAAARPAPPPPPTRAIFNIVDEGNTNQALMAELIHQVFDIPTGFQGAIVCTFARLNLDRVVDEVNDDTLDPWAELQTKAGIPNTTPLSPFMERELLRDANLSLDGSAFVREIGFNYLHPKLTKEGIEEVIDSYRRMNWWP